MSSEHGNIADDDVEAAVIVVKRHRKKLDKMRRKLDEYVGELDKVLEYTGLSESNRTRLIGIRKEEDKTLDQLRETLLFLEGIPRLLREERPVPSPPPTP